MIFEHGKIGEFLDREYLNFEDVFWGLVFFPMTNDWANVVSKSVFASSIEKSKVNEQRLSLRT
jgi:hypothetical protein